MEWMIKPAVIIISLAFFMTAESIHPFYKSLLNKIFHWTSNISISIINGLLGVYLFAAISSISIKSLSSVYPGFINSIDLPVFRAVTYFLLLDLMTYIWHRINHEIKFFWKFHRAHHSDTALDTTTALRFHPFEIFFSTLYRIPFIFLVGPSPQEILIYEIVLSISTLFHHSNWHLPLWIDTRLRTVIVTPAMHRYHHSAFNKETDSNYTSIFSFWDRLFRTYTEPVSPENLKIGLNTMRGYKWQNPAGILATPFISELQKGKKHE